MLYLAYAVIVLIAGALLFTAYVVNRRAEKKIQQRLPERLPQGDILEEFLVTREVRSLSVALVIAAILVTGLGFALANKYFGDGDHRVNRTTKSKATLNLRQHLEAPFILAELQLSSPSRQR